MLVDLLEFFPTAGANLLAFFVDLTTAVLGGSHKTVPFIRVQVREAYSQ